MISRDLRKLASNKLVQKTIKLTSLSLFTNSLVFFVPIYIGYQFQITKETDNFFLSYSIITFISVIFSEAFRSVAIPFLKEHLTEMDLFQNLCNQVNRFILFKLGVLNLLIFLTSIFIFLSTKNQLYLYLALISPIFLLSVLNAFLSGILNSKEKFYIPEFSNLIKGIFVIVSLLLLTKYLGLIAAILGYLVGELIRLIFLKVSLNKLNVDVSFKRSSFNLKQFIRTGSYQIISSAISSSFPLIGKIVASFLVVGSISILDYGDRFAMVFNVLLNSFLTLVLSKWSSEMVSGSFRIDSFNKTLKIVFSITLIVFLMTLLSSEYAISTLYPRMSSSDIKLISVIFSMSMLGYVFNSVNQVINRAIIAFKNTRLLVHNSIFKMVLMLVLSAIFASIWNVEGIAYAIVFVHLFGLIINYLRFRAFYNQKLLNE